MTLEVDRDKAIYGLVTLGLSLGEAKTYVALIENGPSEATPLSRLADVPQPKVYTYLKDLEERHFVDKTVVDGRPNIYEARSYELVIEALEDTINQTKTSVLTSLKKINTDTDQTGELGYVTLVQGERAVNLRLREELLQIKHRAIIFETEYYREIIHKVEEERPEISFIRPIERLRKERANFPLPLQMLLQQMDFSNLDESQPLFLISDHNQEMTTCESTIVVGHPIGEEEPLMIRISHPVIVTYQIKIMKIIMEILERFQNFNPPLNTDNKK